MKIRIMSITALLLFMVTGCSFCQTKGNGQYKTEGRELAAFNKLDLSGAYRVEVHCGETQRVEVNAESNLLPMIKTKVEKGTLYIGSSLKNYRKSRITIKIFVNDIVTLSSSGSCDLLVKNLKNTDFSIDLSGAGNLRIEGSTGNFRASISGAGNLNSESLIAKNVSLSLSGAGHAEVYASDNLDASISGVGSVIYSGDPKNVKKDVSGVGSIKKK